MEPRGVYFLKHIKLCVLTQVIHYLPLTQVFQAISYKDEVSAEGQWDSCALVSVPSTGGGCCSEHRLCISTCAFKLRGVPGPALPVPLSVSRYHQPLCTVPVSSLCPHFWHFPSPGLLSKQTPFPNTG